MIHAVCEITSEPFQISEREQEFCRVNDIPLPRIHPAERLRRLFYFQNRTRLYHDTCKKSGAKILSSIPPQKGLVVYDSKIWESDDWDPLDYGREYDPTRSFFEQFAELQKVVPIPNLSGAASTRENSDFVSGVSRSKNCYLVLGGTDLEDCYYCKRIEHCKNLIDCFLASNSELCYECNNINNCYNLKFSAHCIECSDSTFLTNCKSCSNCFGCVNLVGAKYYFYNEELTPEAYQKKLADIDLSSQSSFLVEEANYKIFAKKFPRPASYGTANEDSTGSFLNNTKNCKNSFFCARSEDLEYCLFVHDSNSSFFHAAFGAGCELIYESVSSGLNLYNVKFSADIRVNVRDIEYCMHCAYGVKDAFGCIGLKRLSHCILNKQYSKSDYESLIAKIKTDMKNRGEYGQFFPLSLSPHYFNHSGATEFFPLKKEAALSYGYSWSEDEIESTKIPFAVLPDSIDSLSATDLKGTFCCSKTQKAFKILPEELKFLKQERLRPPSVAPLARMEETEIISRITPLVDTQCCVCKKSITTMDDGVNLNVACSDCITA